MEYYSPLPAEDPGGNLTANRSVLQAAPVRFDREITIKKINPPRDTNKEAANQMSELWKQFKIHASSFLLSLEKRGLLAF